MANRSRKVGMVKVTSCQADSLLALWILMMCSMSSWAKEPSSNSQPKKEFEWSSKPVCVSPFRRSALKNICWLGYTQVSSVPACKWKSSTNRQSAKFYLWYRRFLALNGQREGLIWSWSLKKDTIDENRWIVYIELVHLFWVQGHHVAWVQGHWWAWGGAWGCLLKCQPQNIFLLLWRHKIVFHLNGALRRMHRHMGTHPGWAPTGSLKYFLFTLSHNHLWCYPPLQKVFLLLSYHVTTS